MPYPLFLDHMIPLLQHMLVLLGLAYLFTKTPVFTALVNNALTWPDKLVIYLVFSSFCILGTFLSEQSFQSAEAITNTRAIGAVLGGLLGGPLVGLMVGVTGGLHRVLSMSSAADPIHYIDVACAVATACEGLFAGLIHRLKSRQGKTERLFSPGAIWPVALLAESGHMLNIVLFGWFISDSGAALRLVMEIAPPMLIANTLGVALIIYMIRDQKRAQDELSSSSRAWSIANQTTGLMQADVDQKTSQKIADIIRKETRVAAVAITDRQRLIAFTGIGAEHHLPGTTISSATTLEAIEKNKVIFSDGITTQYQCSIDDACELGSVLIIPLRDEANNEVFGTIKLYELKHKLFRSINRALGENIAHLLSVNLLAGRYQKQQRLRIQDQYQLLAAQVNPHFLYNALTTISHITLQQPERAQGLLHHLSDFFRKNLETHTDMTTLEHELAHVVSYLEIEKARFEKRLRVSINIPNHLMNCTVPVFTLQPIVENAIKHGTSELLDIGHVCLSCYEDDNTFTLCVEDNAGLYEPADTGRSNGIGLKIDERIKINFGEEYGLKISCEPGQWTKVRIRLPKKVSK